LNILAYFSFQYKKHDSPFLLKKQRFALLKSPAMPCVA
jgi:hypothetical protein